MVCVKKIGLIFVFIVFILICINNKKASVSLRSLCFGWDCKNVINEFKFLTKEECYRLRNDADKKFNEYVKPGFGYKTKDTVDNIYEYQIDYTFDEFKDILGQKADTIFDLPQKLGFSKKDKFYLFHDEYGKYKDQIIIRRYKQGERTSLDWHMDMPQISYVTINVCLSDPLTEYKGGELLVDLDNKNIKAMNRKMGYATIHLYDVLHKVSEVEEGTRYSLIIFMRKK